MDIPDSEQMKNFLLFVVPGIVILFFRSKFLSGRMPKPAEGILSYAAITSAYHAFFFPITDYFLSNPAQSLLNGFIWLLFIFVMPMLVGLFLGIAIRAKWMKSILDKLNVALVHPIGTSWEFRFSDCEECYVMAVLKDGTCWAGLYGQSSFASSTESERDFYLEKVFEIERDGRWTARASSVWLNASEIQSIEFWPKVRI